MTITRLRESRIRAEAETRSLQMGYPSTGYQWADPSAIPPPGMYHLQRAGVVVNAHTLLQVDVVYTALRVISNNILRMGDLRAYTRGYDKSGVEYKQLISDPRPILSNTFGGGSLGGQRGTMMQCTGRDRTIWSMGLFGEAFWFILRDDLENPLGIEILHPAFMEVKTEKGQKTYVYGSGSEKTTLDADNVIHIQHKSLPVANRALSPTDYAGVAGALAMAAYEFGSSWFAQGQSPDFMLTTDQKLGNEEIERIADKFMIRHAGLENAHKPLVFDSGIKPTELMIAPDKAQFLNTLEYARQVIGQWFGIPSSKMPNALQRATSVPPHVRQEEQESFITDCLAGYTIPLEEVHSGLLTAEGEYAGFNEHALTRADAQFLAQKIQALRVTQAYSINDVRVRELGVPPYDDPRADDPLTPLASNMAGESEPEDGSAQGDKGNSPGPKPPKPPNTTGVTTPQGTKPKGGLAPANK